MVGAGGAADADADAGAGVASTGSGRTGCNGFDNAFLTASVATACVLALHLNPI